MQLLFVMDPAETMLPTKDTSFAFMRGALARGHSCLHCLPHQLRAEGAQVAAHARPIVVSDTPPHVTLGERRTVPLREVDAVLIRKDPPFDSAYLHATQVLSLAEGQTQIVNSPAGLRDANEKLFALWFERWQPETLVSSDPAELLAFVDRVGGQAVLKPLDGAGGSGVVLLRTGDRNNRSLVDLHTAEGRRFAMAQRFLPEIERGDKRVLLLDGEVLGVIRRVPRSDDIRANIHVGGSVEGTDLTATEQQLVADVGARLRAHGLWFVGLDLIAERLIEVNVTSPTGIQELGRFRGDQPEQRVIQWLEGRARGAG